jgi:hypothetical protein
VARWSALLLFLFVALGAAIGLRSWLRADAEQALPPAPVPPAAAPEDGAGTPLDSPLEIPSAQQIPSLNAEASLALVASRSASQGLDSVTLFDLRLQNPDFASGERWQLGLGVFDASRDFANDRISAVEIPSGLQLTLFEHAQERGFKLTLGPGRHDLAPYGFDDRTSSLRVSHYGQSADVSGPHDCVVLYEHRAVDLLGRGLAWRLELPRGRDEWTFRVAHGVFPDNQASTAWVAQGFELVLFDDVEASGVALVLGPGLHELELLGFNDRASAARVRRTR